MDKERQEKAVILDGSSIIRALSRISYEILERTLVKLSDGKRALEYRLSVHLGPPDASAYGFAAGVKLLVYLP